MSDPGLDADLTLDIRQALAAVSRLEEAATRSLTNVRMTVDARAVTAGIDAAVINADTNVAIVGDARELTRDITAAVDAADTGVVVTGDARDLTRDVTAAVDAADSNVVVTGDASELTGDVTAAIDAADTTVTVTGSVDQGLRQGVQGLDEDLTDAVSSAGLLRGSLAALSAGAVVAGLYQMAQAASDFGESSSKAAVVFGDSFDDIARFSEGAATAVGLSNTAALEATGTFGNLFQALGATQDVAADLSPQVVTLAGDLASFNNLGIEDTLEKLRSGLVGEVEPLRSLGVSFTAVQVEAKAVELGLAAVGEEVSEGAKLQARFALIMEQTTLAQGDFARTSEGLANQQRILTAEFQNAVTAAGQALLPALLDLVAVAREDLIPAFGEFATEALPPLASILADLAPLFGVTLDLVVALAPVFGVLAKVVDAIPEPLLVLIGSMVALNRIMPASGTGLDRIAIGLFKLAGSADGAVAGITKLNPVMLGVAAAFTLYTFQAQRAAAEERRMRKETEELTSALADQDGVVRVTSAGIAEYVETQSRFESRNQIDDLARLGLTFEQVADASLAGEAGQRRFIDAALRSGEIVQLYRDNLGNLVDETGKVVGSANNMSSSFGHVQEVNGRLVAGNTDLLASYDELVEVETRAAKAALDEAVASGAITQAQREHFEATNKSKDGQINYAAALHDAQREIDRHAAALAAATAKYGPQIAASKALGSAYSSLGNENRSLLTQLQAFQSGGMDDTEIILYAAALDEASLSEEGMAAAAALLGTDVATLTNLVGGLTGAVNEFADSALSGLPTIGDAFKPAERGARSAGGATKDLAKETRDAERAIRDASRGVDEANRGIVESYEAVEEASRGVTDAAEDLADAQRAVLRAEEDLARLRQGATARDLEEAELDIESARIASERSTLRIADAEADLAEARAEGDSLAIRKAELDLEDARIQSRESVFGVQDAELALQEVRQKGTETDQAVIDAQDALAQAYEGVDDAQRALIDANEAVVDAQRGVEDAAYGAVTAMERLSDAEEALANVGKGGGGGGGGGGVGAATQASLREFIANLHKNAAEIRDFMADLDAIFEAGGQDIAATLATEGFEAGNAYADELAASISGGASALVAEAEAAVDDHNAAINEAEIFLRTEFGPKYITTTGLVASLASEAFGSDLSFEDRIRIAGNLAQSTMSEEGKAIALIAATEGERAATDYAALFDIDAKTLAEGIAAAKTLSGPVASRVGTAAEDAATAGLTGFEDTWSALTGVAVDEVDAANVAISGTAPKVEDAGIDAATGGVTGWEDTWSKIPGLAVGAVGAASTGVRGTAGQLREAGAAAGGAAAGGFKGEVEPGFKEGAEAGKTAAGKAINENVALTGVARLAGLTVGTALSSGIAEGIESVPSIRAIRNAATRAIREAEDAARDEAQSRSPSKLFAKLGMDLGLGAAEGLEGAIPDVVAQAEAIVRAAALAVDGAELGAPALSPLVAGRVDQVGALAAASGGFGDGGLSIEVNLGGLVFHAAVTPEQANKVAAAATAAAMATATEKAKALAVLQQALRVQVQR